MMERPEGDGRQSSEGSDQCDDAWLSLRKRVGRSVAEVLSYDELRLVEKSQKQGDPTKVEQRGAPKWRGAQRLDLDMSQRSKLMINLGEGCER